MWKWASGRMCKWVGLKSVSLTAPEGHYYSNVSLHIPMAQIREYSADPLMPDGCCPLLFSYFFMSSGSQMFPSNPESQKMKVVSE